MKLKKYATKIVKRSGDKGVAYAGRKENNVYVYTSDGQLLSDKTFPTNSAAKKHFGALSEV